MITTGALRSGCLLPSPLVILLSGRLAPVYPVSAPPPSHSWPVAVLTTLRVALDTPHSGSLLLGGRLAVAARIGSASGTR
jgi:hypothetical protein